MSAPAVIGLDLSITATGICDRIGECYTVGGPSKDGDARLVTIAEAVEAACFPRAPLTVDETDLVVIEDLPTHARGAGVTAMVHGVVRMKLHSWGYWRRYVLVPPATLKKFATGRGNASKPEMAVAAFKRAGVEFADDNQCDAFWLRVAGLTALGHPPFELPKVQVDALAKVDWPEVSP